MGYFLKRRVKKDIKNTIESLLEEGTCYRKKIDPKTCKETRTTLKDIWNIQKEKLQDEFMLGIDLKHAYEQCTECKGVPNDNNCVNLVTRLGIIQQYVV